MTRGMRLMIMVLILIGVVVGMMQCASKTMHKKKPRLQEDGRAPLPAFYLADLADARRPAGTDS
jgi:disulfide bond formation protein DsbB